MGCRHIVMIGGALVATACSDGAGIVGGVSVEGTDAVFVIEDTDLSAGGAKPPEAPGPPLAVGPFLLQASGIPEDTSSATPPMSLRFTVTATNADDTSAVLAVDGCTVWPEVFESPARDEAPVWLPQGQCAQDPYTRTIAPNESEVFSFLAHNVMLGSALSDGRYYASVQFRKTGETVVLAAGHADVRLRQPGLSFQVVVEEGGGEVRASVVTINLNSTPVHLEFGACALSLGLYRNEERTDQAASWHWAELCPAYLMIGMLAPGDSLAADEFAAAFDPSTLDRNAGVRAGSYYLTVDLHVNWRTYSLPAGRIAVW